MFIVGNMLEASAPRRMLKPLEERIDIVYAGSIFHLFDWSDQLLLAHRVAAMLKPVPGSLILGRQRGNVNAAEYEHRTNAKGTMFRHNEQSFKRMWDEVGKNMGMEWAVEVWLEKDEDFGTRDVRDDRRLYFEVKRK